MFPTTEWFGVAVESSVGWPLQRTTVEFEGYDLELRPGSDTESPNVRVTFPRNVMTQDQAHELLRRYLSALSWTDQAFIRELFCLGGGADVKFGLAHRVRHTAMRFVDRVHPVPNDARASLALALYREALGAVTVPYQVLGFAKIINIINEHGGGQKSWIRAMLPHISDAPALARVTELQQSGADVAEHVYGKRFTEPCSGSVCPVACCGS